MISTTPLAAPVRLSPLFETPACLGEPILTRCMLAFLKPEQTIASHLAGGQVAHDDGRPKLDDSSDSDVEYDTTTRTESATTQKKTSVFSNWSCKMHPRRGTPGLSKLILTTKIRLRTSPKWRTPTRTMGLYRRC